MVCELDAAAGVDRHFQSGDALKAPGGIGDGLDQIAFTLSDRPKIFLVFGDMLLVSSDIVGGKQDRAAGERGFDSVEGRAGFSFE